MKEDVLKNAQVTLNEEKGKPEHCLVFVKDIDLASGNIFCFICCVCVYRLYLVVEIIVLIVKIGEQGKCFLPS